MGKMKELVIDMRNAGYETLEDQEALLEHMQAYQPPWTRYSNEEHIKWVEFCRGLKESDFTTGDEFSLNGIPFIVGTTEDLQCTCLPDDAEVCPACKRASNKRFGDKIPF